MLLLPPDAGCYRRTGVVPRPRFSEGDGRNGRPVRDGPQKAADLLKAGSEGNRFGDEGLERLDPQGAQME